jgi:hypothetical protein
MTSSIAIPEACSVAFKEWSGICAALSEGRQSLILRKGGIAEDAGRFLPEHDAFWLYPTHLHEVQQGLREELPISPRSPTPFVAIEALALVDTVARVDSLDALDALADLHVWSEETVRRRFHYRAPGLWALGVRIFRRSAPWLIEPTEAHAGCKSWVPLETPLSTAGLSSILGESTFTARMERLRSVTDSQRPDGHRS